MKEPEKHELKKEQLPPPHEKNPPPLDKEEAIAFAQEIMSAAGLLAEKYHRELDEDQLIVWAIRGLFEAAKEPVPSALEQKMRKDPPAKPFDQLDLLVDARETLGKRKELVAPRDADTALQSIFQKLDSHTTLLDADAVTRLNLMQNGNRAGELGLRVRRQQKTETVEVVTPYRDSPAYKAGIRAGDVITRLRLLDGPDGKALADPEDIAPGALVEEDGGRASWGPIGSRVEVTVRQPGSDRLQAFTLTRARVKKEKVLGVKRRADESWDHLLDAKAGTYYVRLTDFHGPDTARELDQLLASFKEPKLRTLVLDLRFTGSGLIQTAFDVADLFIANGLIVEFRSRKLVDGKGRWMSRGKGKYASIPIACLISTEAGTCTELVASALQDHKRACLVGERTSGKASAQNYFPTERGTLRITTSHAYRPNGKPLDHSQAVGNVVDWGILAALVALSDKGEEWGVTPDKGYAVSLSATERAALREWFLTLFRLSRRDPADTQAPNFRDRQLEKALEYLRRQGE